MVDVLKNYLTSIKCLLQEYLCLKEVLCEKDDKDPLRISKLD